MRRRATCRPKVSASDWFTSWIVTPSRPWLTLPCCWIWSLTFIATSIGIANARPWKPPVRLKICELTPITSPLRLNSGPPELPGFTAASVWMNGTAASPGSERDLALTMPEVTVLSRP